MQAVILAAGMGKRLGKFTQDNTKCMLPVNGKRLIDRALESLQKIGVTRVVLVVGYKGDNVRHYVGTEYRGLPIEYVNNPIYDKTNNIYSFYLAAGYFAKEDTILLESDIIFEDTVLERLVACKEENVAVVDKYASWMDGTVVNLGEDNSITRFIDKSEFKFSNAESYYKTVNIYKFSRTFLSNYFLPFLEAYLKAKGNNEYYEQVLRVILSLSDSNITAMPLSGELWYEIDDAQDLDIASCLFSKTEEKYDKLSNRYGGFWRFSKLLDYSYLVNPFFPPQKMKAEIRSCFDTLLCEYPSGMSINSMLAAKCFGLLPEFTAVGNGASELIKVLIENHVGKVGYVLPTFEEYPNRLDDAKKISFVPQTDGFRYSADDIVAFFDKQKIETLILINPDNPSGNYISQRDVLRLVEWTKHKGFRFVIDESFIDFADESHTLMNNDILADNKHLFVVKSISKSYGVPGVRLGILASGDADTIERIKKEVSIWNINSFGEFFLQILDKYKNHYFESCLMFKEERKRFYDELSKLDYLLVFPSQANYFLCKLEKRYTSADFVNKLLEHDILVKDCGKKAAFAGEDFVRIAVRGREDNNRLISVLKSL